MTIQVRCPRCGVRWAGTAKAHCATCHRTFAGAGAFTKHRTADRCDVSPLV